MRAVPGADPEPVVGAAIRAKYAGRRVPLAVAVRDRLGQWMADELFAAAFGVRGRPGLPPSRLALVTVLQMAEELTDREAAEAVRTRLDWQYALGLGLADPGFDHSRLSEFRGRVAEHELEEAALDALLAKAAAEGLVKAGGGQRSAGSGVGGAGEVEGGGVPGVEGARPAHIRISSPYDADARWGAKKDLSWLGYKLHISETCDVPPACGCPPAPAAPGRCAHDVRPNLITCVMTTRATVCDIEMTTPVSTALAGRDLAPGRHYLDTGYASALTILDAARLAGITLVTPLRADGSRQARARDRK